MMIRLLAIAVLTLAILIPLVVWIGRMTVCTGGCGFP